MSTAYWCVFAAGLLPYVAITIAKSDKTYLRGNVAPREWEAKLQGLQSRAHSAHLNSFEAFPFFAAAVIIANLCKVPQASVDGIAIAFVIARVIYLACYLANLATPRSLVWLAGMALNVWLFMLAARATS
jgi:uncharacterized MAPEG superfamily protein